MSSLANIWKVANYVAGCLMVRYGGVPFYNQQACLSCSKYCDRVTPFSWKRRWPRNVWWLSDCFGSCGNQACFPEPPLSFFLLFYWSALFVIGFLVLMSDCRLCTWHSNTFLCVEVKACEGSTCPEEYLRAHVLLVSINAVVSILSSLLSQGKYPS